jgi:hypothetical protein
MASEDSGGVAERSELVARAPDYGKAPYWISCDPAKTEIRVQRYPSPGTIKKETSSTSRYLNVTVIKPGVPGKEQCQDHPSCPETDWTVTYGTKDDIATDWASK